MEYSIFIYVTGIMSTFTILSVKYSKGWPELLLLSLSCLGVGFLLTSVSSRLVLSIGLLGVIFCLTFQAKKKYVQYYLTTFILMNGSAAYSLFNNLFDWHFSLILAVSLPTLIHIFSNHVRLVVCDTDWDAVSFFCLTLLIFYSIFKPVEHSWEWAHSMLATVTETKIDVPGYFIILTLPVFMGCASLIYRNWRMRK